MATGDGPRPDHLTLHDRLVAAPGRFHIFHALRVIEAHHADAPAMGQSRRPREDHLRLGQEAELAFPPDTIRSYTPARGAGQPGVLINRFFGLFGQHGPLPQHMTEYARERQVNFRDPTLISFANMLTHRMMGLLYRAWTTGQPAPGMDRGEGGSLEQKVAALAGHAGPALAARDAIPDLAKRHFTAHLAQGPKTAEGLVAMLSAFFKAPVHLQPFVGSWLDLEPDDRWSLGASAGLGQATSVGARVWSRAAKFRLIVGPLALEDYLRLLPGTDSLKRMTALVRNHAGDALDFDVNLVLKAADVPVAVLGQETRLGQTSWLGRRQNGGDAADLLLAPLGFPG